MANGTDTMPAGAGPGAGRKEKGRHAMGDKGKKAKDKGKKQKTTQQDQKAKQAQAKKAQAKQVK